MGHAQIFSILLWLISIQNSFGMDRHMLKEFLPWFSGKSHNKTQHSKGQQSKTEQLGEIFDLLNALTLMVEENIEWNGEGEGPGEGEWWAAGRRVQKEGALWGDRVVQLVANLPPAASGMKEKSELQKVMDNWHNIGNLELGPEISELKALAEELGQLSTEFKVQFDGSLTNKAIVFQIIDHFGDWNFEKRFLHRFLANSKEFYYSKSVAEFFTEITASEIILKKILALIEASETDETVVIEESEDGRLSKIKKWIRNIKNRLNLLEQNLSNKLEIKVEKEKIEHLVEKSSLRENLAENLQEKLTEIEKVANLEGTKVAQVAVIVAFAISQVEDAQTELQMACQKLDTFAKRHFNHFKRVKNILDAAHCMKKLRKSLLQCKSD